MKRFKGMSAARWCALSIIALASVALPASAQTAPAVLFSSTDSAGLASSLEIDSTGTVTYTGNCNASTCPVAVTMNPAINQFATCSSGTAVVGTGVICFSGTVGPFQITNAVLTSKPIEGSAMDLGLGGVTTATGGTLTVTFTDVGFNFTTGPVLFSIQQSPVATSYNAWFDPGNKAFAETDPINTSSLQNTSATTLNVSVPATVSTVPDSLTGQLVVALSSGITYTSDFGLFPTTRQISLTCPVATGTVGVPYSASLTASGGVQPYNFSIVSGSLPNGLILTTTSGAITGTPTTAATFDFAAQVVDSSGIAGINTVMASCGIVIAPQSGVISGDAATIGFWHNKNGQALILALNGGSSSESLANWLASSFPYLYGVNSSNNLTNQTNAAVAALFLTFFGEKGQKTDAQLLAGALACYVTNSTLAGTTAKSYGFNSSTGGTGAKTYNVGSDGSALGLLNNGTYTVLQLLMQANLTKMNGTYNANALNDVFNGINTTGDIS